MRDFNFDEFIEVLARDEESTQGEKKREQEREKEMEFYKSVNELVDEIMEMVNKERIECERAREIDFLEHKDMYHSSIENCIKRPLSIEEINIVDIAFQFAFINGWLVHKKNGGNNDK